MIATNLSIAYVKWHIGAAEASTRTILSDTAHGGAAREGFIAWKRRFQEFNNFNRSQSCLEQINHRFLLVSR